MYKCVDERGVTHYADQPTPGCMNTAVEIRPSPPISPNVAPPPAERRAEQEADFRRRQVERHEAERAARAELEQRCQGLRQERARLSPGRRLVETNERGERVYVEDATRDRRLAEVQTSLERCR